MKTYSYYHAHRESINPIERADRIEAAKIKTYIPSKRELEVVKRGYQILLPLHQSFEKLASGEISSLEKETFFDGREETAALIAVRLFQLERALEILLNLEREGSFNPQMQLLTGQLLIKFNRLDEGIERLAILLDKMVELFGNDDPHLLPVFLSLGQAYLEKKELNRSLSYFNQSLHIIKRYPEACVHYKGRGLLWIGVGISV